MYMCFCFITRKLTSNWISENGVALQKAMPIIWKHPVAPLDDDAWQDFCMSHRKMAIKKQNNARLGSVIELSPGFFSKKYMRRAFLRMVLWHKRCYNRSYCASWEFLCNETKSSACLWNACVPARTQRRGYNFWWYIFRKVKRKPFRVWDASGPKQSEVRHFEGALHGDI